MEYLVRLHFPASNNTAEYEALINGLRIIVELGMKCLEMRGDSELVVDQVMKDKNYVDPKMAVCCQAVRDIEGKFHSLVLHHVLRDYNKAAGVLAKTASSCSPVRTEGEKTPEESELEVMAIDQPPELNLEDPDWRFPILEWLVKGKLPSDQTEARHIARRAKAFVLIDGELYKCGAAGILMRSILGDQGCELLQEIHAGTCGHHAGLRTLVGKDFRQGFTGPRRSQTSRTSCGTVKCATSTLDKLTSRHRHYKPSPSRVLSPSGTSTWWGHSDKRPGASPTSW
jgi:hypothetical protein